MMTVNGVQCPKCKDVIYSMAGHDFHYCTCGEVFIDGGQDGWGGRVGFTKEIPPPAIVEVDVADKRELASIWAKSPIKGPRELGVLKGGQSDKRQRLVSIDGVASEPERDKERHDSRSERKDRKPKRNVPGLAKNKRRNVGAERAKPAP